jgi:DNA topoisomerase IA
MHPLSDCASVVAAEALRRSRMLYEKSQRTIASQMSDVLYDSTVLTFDCAGEFFKAKGADPLRGVSQGLQRCEEEKADRIPRRNANPEDEEQSFRRWTGRGVPKIGEELEEKQTRPPCATRRNPR